MLIGGFQKFSLIDYPGKICAIIFTQGCNFHCPYCYNPELVKSELFTEPISEEKIFSFLDKRKGKLDAVEITGGEPTIQKDLLGFLKKIKDKNFLVKLDSNGTNPDVIKRAIDSGLIDYVAMDVKAPVGAKTRNSKLKTQNNSSKLKISKYDKATGVKVNLEKIKKSVEILKNSGIDYEFRTTVVPGIHTKKDILEIAKEIGPAKRYYLQNFRPEKTLDPRFEKIKPYPDEYILEIVREISSLFDICQMRG